MLAWLTSRLAWVAALVAGALAAFGWARRDAAKDARASDKEKDRERAQGIRDRVDAVPDGRLHDDDDRGYRD